MRIKKREECQKNKDRIHAMRAHNEKRNLENEKQKARMRQPRQDEEKKKMENEKQKANKSASRKDPEKRDFVNNRQNKTKKVASDKKRRPFNCIAVKVAQDQFAEKDILESLINSYLGSLFDKSNQCQYCKAFRFKKETNFCCSQGDVVIPTIPDPPKTFHQEIFHQQHSWIQ